MDPQSQFCPTEQCRHRVCWPLGSSGPTLGLWAIHVHVQKQKSHTLTAHRLHEAWEPAPLCWFPLPHNDPAEWILMHRP